MFGHLNQDWIALGEEQQQADRLGGELERVSTGVVQESSF